MIDRPQAEIAGDGADDRDARLDEQNIGSVHGMPEAQHHAHPQQRQGYAVGDQLMIDVDRRDRDQRPGQDDGGSGLPAEPEAPRHRG